MARARDIQKLIQQEERAAVQRIAKRHDPRIEATKKMVEAEDARLVAAFRRKIEEFCKKNGAEIMPRSIRIEVGKTYGDIMLKDTNRHRATVKSLTSAKSADIDRPQMLAGKLNNDVVMYGVKPETIKGIEELRAMK